MSACQQAKAARRKARNNNAHLGNAKGRVIYRYGGRGSQSVAESIARARAQAAAEARRNAKKK